MSDETWKPPWSTLRNDVHVPRLEDGVLAVDEIGRYAQHNEANPAR